MKHDRLACDENEWRAGSKYEHIEVTRTGVVRNARTGRELATNVGKTGYEQLTIRPEGRKGRAKLVKVHRLVAHAWIGDPPTPQHVVNHRDGNKLNNNVENLEWVTPSENMRHAHRMGLKVPLRGEQMPNAKLTRHDVLRIRRVYQPWHARYGARPLAREYGVHHAHIIAVARGEEWPHVKGSAS